MYDLFCERMEQVRFFETLIREDVKKYLVEVIRLFGYYPLDSPFLLPRSDYFRYLFFFDSLCSWIVDTRTAFHC